MENFGSGSQSVSYVLVMRTSVVASEEDQQQPPQKPLVSVLQSPSKLSPVLLGKPNLDHTCLCS